MSLLKYVAIGAVAAYGISYLVKKQANGKSIIDDIADKAPDWMDTIKKYGQDALDAVSQKANQTKESF